YQLKIWTATNYTKNKNCLIKASISLRLTIQEESITKLISSSSNSTEHQKSSSNSTTTNESSISKKTSSITSVENVQFANKDYPTLLDTHVHTNSIKFLHNILLVIYPSIQSYNERLTSLSSSNTNIVDKIKFFDFSSLVSTSSSS
ncbi:unnamed protein product, partial [Rotaria sp. Silwood2]